MSVTLHLPAVLAKLADARAIESDAPTVGAVVADVSTRYPALGARLRDDAGNAYPFVTFYLNDEDIRFHGGLLRRGGAGRRRADRGAGDRRRVTRWGRTDRARSRS
jgi:molybdopterin converting factor small subunit